MRNLVNMLADPLFWLGSFVAWFVFDLALPRLLRLLRPLLALRWLKPSRPAPEPFIPPPYRVHLAQFPYHVLRRGGIVRPHSVLVQGIQARATAVGIPGIVSVTN